MEYGSKTEKTIIVNSYDVKRTLTDHQTKTELFTIFAVICYEFHH